MKSAGDGEVLMKLFCQVCNRVTLELSQEYVTKILAKLTQPAHREIVDCPKCHQFQWSVAAKDVARDSSGQ
jgi:uncharacterized protein with PIN domain